MERKKTNAIVHRPGTDVFGLGRGTSPVIARMTRDVLARGGAQALGVARFRIGDHLLREPDYRQILQWAEALGMAPETVLEVLVSSELTTESCGWSEPIAFALEEGAIVNLTWDFDRLPLVPEIWESGLLVRTLGFRGAWPEPAIALRPSLPHLRTLVCGCLGLASLDLSQVPGLTVLDCRGNRLIGIDLSPVPRLTSLECSGNQITRLDLATVPGLTWLGCGGNQITEIDLSPVPRLTSLE